MPFASNSAVATVVIPEELLGGTDCKQVRIGMEQFIDFTDDLAGRAACKKECKQAKLRNSRRVHWSISTMAHKIATKGCNKRCNSLR